MAAPNPKALKEVQAYLTEKKALILDPSSASRPAIRKLMSTLGVKTANIDIVETFKEASEYIAKNKPEVVWCEYELTKNNGLELFAEYKKIFPSRLNSSFILLSEKNSPSTASRAAEEDVDALVIRPFTFDSLQSKFLDVLKLKMSPTNYSKLIETAKAMLEEGKAKEALEIFLKARTSDPKPSLACYYAAQAYLKLEDEKNAELLLNEGLKHTPDHYKCLSGSLELHLKKKNHKVAYELGQKLFQCGPVNPKYIPKMIWLSIFNQTYDDILNYRDLAQKVEAPPDGELSNSVSAGLIVYGHHLLKEQSLIGAVDTFKSAEMLCKSKPIFMKEIILLLLRFGASDEAQQFMSRATEEVRNSKEILLGEFDQLVKSKNAASILQTGQKLLKLGITESVIYENVLKASVEMKRGNAVMDDLLSAAVVAHPDKKDLFESLVKKPS